MSSKTIDNQFRFESLGVNMNLYCDPTITKKNVYTWRCHHFLKSNNLKTKRWNMLIKKGTARSLKLHLKFPTDILRRYMTEKRDRSKKDERNWTSPKEKWNNRGSWLYFFVARRCTQKIHCCPSPIVLSLERRAPIRLINPEYEPTTLPPHPVQLIMNIP